MSLINLDHHGIAAWTQQFRKEGYPVDEEDKARLSPLIHEHINTQGRHSFVMPEAVVKGELRPLTISRQNGASALKSVKIDGNGGF
jgi:hypothetical protein